MMIIYWVDTVKKARESLKMSPKEFADYLNLYSHVSVNIWEDGYKDPSIENQQKILAILKEKNLEPEFYGVC